MKHARLFEVVCVQSLTPKETGNAPLLRNSFDALWWPLRLPHVDHGTVEPVLIAAFTSSLSCTCLQRYGETQSPNNGDGCGEPMVGFKASSFQLSLMAQTLADKCSEFLQCGQCSRLKCGRADVPPLKCEYVVYNIEAWS